MTHLQLPNCIITIAPMHSLHVHVLMHVHVFKQALTTGLNMWKLTQAEPKTGI